MLFKNRLEHLIQWFNVHYFLFYIKEMSDDSMDDMMSDMNQMASDMMLQMDHLKAFI